MASSGKKGKKIKGTTLTLNTFLASGSTPSSTGTVPVLVRKTNGSWADDVEEERVSRVLLPTGPRASFGNSIDDELVPREPPFTAYVSNLPYEVEEDELCAFFKDLQVFNVRLLNSGREGGGRRGCGYVEFDDRPSLISALNMSEQTLKGRPVRIQVSDNADNDRRRMRDMGRDHMDGPDRTRGDWRSGPREDTDRDGYDRGRSGSRREYGSSGFRDSYGDRDRGGFDRDRSGRFDSSGGFDRDRRMGDRDYGRSGFGAPRRGYDRELERDGYRRSDGPPSGEPRSRQKLNLQPRTKPLEEVAAPQPVTSVDNPPVTGSTSASIFGGAKPVDTAAREREIEERLARERGIDGGGRQSRDTDRDRTTRFTSSSGDRRKDDGLASSKQPSENSWRQPKQTEPLSTRNEPEGNDRVSPHSDRSSEYDSEVRNRKVESGQPTQPRAWATTANETDELESRPLKGIGSTKGVTTSVPPRGRSDAPPSNIDKDERRNKSDDEASRMPKYQEQEAPNFVASNKYAFLHEDDEVPPSSD